MKLPKKVPTFAVLTATLQQMETDQGPIGIFDSGYGGLTILRDILKAMPGYDYLYLGDNARAPYGTRSFDIVYRFTLQAVRYLFDRGCRLVVLGCNTASAKALRTIQQNDLPVIDPSRRVLGVIRPTVEKLPELTANGHIGVLGTPGTVSSRSYELEVAKFHPSYRVTGHGCPMWVPLVENREADSPGADFFIKQEVDRLMAADADIDTIILACTHYPLLYDKIRRYTPQHVKVVKQGDIIASSLVDYLRRHPEMDSRCSRGGTVGYFTTESSEKFSEMATLFLGFPVKATQISL